MSRRARHTFGCSTLEIRWMQAVSCPIRGLLRGRANLPAAASEDEHSTYHNGTGSDACGKNHVGTGKRQGLSLGRCWRGCASITVAVSGLSSRTGRRRGSASRVTRRGVGSRRRRQDGSSRQGHRKSCSQQSQLHRFHLSKVPVRDSSRTGPCPPLTPVHRFAFCVTAPPHPPRSLAQDNNPPPTSPIALLIINTRPT